MAGQSSSRIAPLVGGFLMLVMALATPASAQYYSCYTYTASCRGDNYDSTSCGETSTNCTSGVNNTCVSGSTYVSFLGVNTRTWVKRCLTASESDINCSTQNQTCSSVSLLGVSSSSCYSCCVGDVCNSGAPIRASSSQLRAWGMVATVCIALSSAMLATVGM